MAALLMAVAAQMDAQEKKEFTLEVYGGEIPDVKPAFEEEHFLGGEITRKWNTFLCNYTHTYDVEVGLSASGTEFRKPAVFKAVERVNKYVKKSFKSHQMTREEATRIMTHVLIVPTLSVWRMIRLHWNRLPVIPGLLKRLWLSLTR